MTRGGSGTRSKAPPFSAPLGGGKTSGSGRAIAHAFLKAGFGGLVLCAKVEERAMWERWARECGRTPSIIVFDGSGQRRINFLHYELGRHTDGHALTMNAVRLLETVLDAAEGKNGQSTTENPFWRKAVRQILSNAIQPLYSGMGRVTLRELMQMIQTRPMTPRQALDTSPKGMQWRSTSKWWEFMDEALKSPVHPIPAPDYNVIYDYWTQMAQTDAKTVSNVIATMSADLAPFMTGRLREVFATTTNIVPELTHEGAIIIMDWPIPEYDEVGLLAQQVFKYLWQRSVERRPVNDQTRPVFLWADECQFFLNPYDAKFQSISRQKRSATVYITQNLPLFYDRIGTQHPEHTADALLGNFQTKIWHTNSCPKTNQWAADIIGKGIQWRRNVNVSENTGWQEGWNEGTNTGENVGANYGTSSTRGTSSGTNTGGGGGWSSSSQPGGSWNTHYNYGSNEGVSDSDGTNVGQSVGRSRGSSRGTSGGTSGGHSRSAGASEVIDYHLQPSFFTTLRTGGNANNGIVEAVLFQGGRGWSHSRSTWLPLAFSQS